MKKVSTTVAKETNNFSTQKLTIGLDLGDRSSWYCVLDEASVILLEQRLGTTPKAMREVFGGGRKMMKEYVLCLPIEIQSRRWNSADSSAPAKVAPHLLSCGV